MSQQFLRFKSVLKKKSYQLYKKINEYGPHYNQLHLVRVLNRLVACMLLQESARDLHLAQ